MIQSPRTDERVEYALSGQLNTIVGQVANLEQEIKTKNFRITQLEEEVKILRDKLSMAPALASPIPQFSPEYRPARPPTLPPPLLSNFIEVVNLESPLGSPPPPAPTARRHSGK